MNCIFEVTEDYRAPLYEKEETADTDIRETKKPIKGRDIADKKVILSALFFATLSGMTTGFIF